jgi:hypothetical protein
MRPGKPADPAVRARIMAELRRDREVRDQSYRGRALALFPHVCARCAREFSGKRLRELTVHHKDGDYKHNPPDGSNWELLCLYCHDHEHEKADTAGQCAMSPADTPSSTKGFSPFSGLDSILGSGSAEQGEPGTRKE